MRVYIFILIFIILGCSTKTVLPEYFRIGESYFNNYVKTYLKNEKKLADKYFTKAVAEFKKSDDMCNTATLYLKKYFLEEELSFNISSYLTAAKYYAKIGECDDLVAIIKFYELNNGFDISKIKDPFYKQYFLFISKGEYEDLIKDLKNYSDYVNSKVYRLISLEHLHKGNNDLAEKFINNAYQIDKSNSYTLYLLQDLRVKYNICVKKKANCMYLMQRIKELEDVIKN
ncbi:hypothetical protein OWM07_05625 [Deferribacter thermophilus]|uniref:hypothetical protein n=1 Tax=Deferribacter thermophilus TaxID=53573 RepID=UPI003C23B54A